MNKIWLIIRREYFTRVRNKAFIVLTLLAPLFYGLLIALPVLATRLGSNVKEVFVVDETNEFKGRLKDTNDIHFAYPAGNISNIKSKMLKKDGPQLVLYIPKDLNPFHPDSIQLFARKNVGLSLHAHLESTLAERIRELKISRLNLRPTVLDSLKTSVALNVRAYSGDGDKASSSAAASAAAFGGGLLIYMFIFLYGGLVLRGVQEEKQNRIVEIIISSVKPFQLMMGKIIGVAMVGLTQFIVWVVLTVSVTVAFQVILSPSPEQLHELQKYASGPGSHMVVAPQMENAAGFQKVMSAIDTLNLPLLLGMFVFFFLGGYLLYSSLFAACAAAVDSQSDMYQFMFPISLPIIVSISLIGSILENPDSKMAFWLSMIPFTSPVIMMARLPFDVPAWQIALSMLFLIGGFICTTWLAGKIYRIGILMYGKKTTYKELFKWLFY